MIQYTTYVGRMVCYYFLVCVLLASPAILSGLDVQSVSSIQETDFTKGEECNRKCDDISKNCYFTFVIERYAVMGGACRNCSNGVMEDCFLPQCVTANGHLRPFISINRQLPGPSIQVCRGDRIIVDVQNQMPDETTSIHWHGIQQKGSQYFDGVPFVTQCPIQPGTSFRYTFLADHAGTFFYHSHTGIQKADGLSGSLIVREKEQEETLSHLYEEDLPEHVMVIQDWTNIPAENYMPGFFSRSLNQAPDTILINGRGLHYSNSIDLKFPLSEFVVEKGKSYRLRLIGSTCLTCSVRVQFQGHRLLVISADGGLKFKPVLVDTVILNSADRFDAVLVANQTESIYRILVRGVGESCSSLYQVGALRYNTKELDFAQVQQPISNEERGVVFNAVNSTCNKSNTDEICICMLEGTEDAIDHKKSSRSYHQIPISFNVYEYADEDLFRNGTYQRYDEPVAGLRLKTLINDISFMFPPSPLITQLSDIPSEDFCSEDCYNSTNKPCSCSNVYNVPSDTVVDLIIYDSGERNGFDHPFHLHGYNFYILDMGVLKEDKQERLKELASLSEKLREDNVDLKYRPMKDTISVPARGFVLARFVADNPGYWLFHCHYAFHLEGGMAAVLKVGNESELPPKPRNFPQCGNFKG